MASSEISGRIGWPELCFPPVNLWVMPAWHQAGGMPLHHRARGSRDVGMLQRQFLQLLSARAGGE